MVGHRKLGFDLSPQKVENFDHLENGAVALVRDRAVGRFSSGRKREPRASLVRHYYARLRRLPDDGASHGDLRLHERQHPLISVFLVHGSAQHHVAREFVGGSGALSHGVRASPQGNPWCRTLPYE